MAKGIFNKQGQLDDWPRDAWDQYTYQCCPIELPDGTFRLYYQCYGLEGNPNSGPAVLESDSITGPWTKPIVGLIEYPSGSGNTDNNLIVFRDTTGAIPMEFIDIIHDGTEYILLVMQKATAQSQIWTSDDGLDFTFGGNIFLGADLNGGEYAEPKGILYDGVTYKVYYRSMPGGAAQRRSIGYYESALPTSGFVDQGFLADFISVNSTLQYYDFRAQEHNGAWWGFFPLYNSVTEELGPIMLHRSLDSGATWEQRGMALDLGYVDPSNHPVRTADAEGEFDSVMTTASKPILVGDTWYLLYGASPQAHDTWPRPMYFGVATSSNFDKKYDNDLTFYAPFGATGQLLPLIGTPGSCLRAGGGRTYYDKGGKLNYSFANNAVLDHDPISNDPLGLSIFERRVALVTDIVDLSNASWTKDNVTIDTDVADNGDGFNSMDRVAVTTGGAARHRVFQQVTAPGLSYLDVGAFIKDDGGRYMSLSLLGSTDDYCTVIVDLELGIGKTYDGVSGFIQEFGIDPVGNGVYRIWMVAIVVNANPFVVVNLNSNYDAPSIDGAGGEAFIGTLGNDIFANGITAHISTFHTPYTPSTCNLDLIDFSDVSWFNNSAGTFYLDFTPARIDTDSFVLEIDVTINDGIVVWLDQPSGTLAIFKNSTSGPTGYITMPGVVTKDQRIKIAFAYASNDFACYVDGVAGTPDTDMISPSTNDFTRLRLGSRSDGTKAFCGLIHDIRYFETRKSNEVIQLMSEGKHGPQGGVGNGAKTGGIGFGKFGGLGKL